MNRTQIILDSETKIELQRYAYQTDQSISELIRTGMKEFLEKNKKNNRGVQGLKHLARISRKGGPTNLSATIDKILY
ncbi:MAG: hypothetical protein G01um101418_632 [Parcubacteria group bacterium Gr01-1014_18]|nr:MAG: hypothetical protein Greene041636_657 [Parcubacteria group bacterium Greene0416_36]TSC80713.1 MAG: hypothetical protein G01um101418_632 [Parcubacteria group bacterium Gr01-1014_18]TSC98676.1 MAG: hypothetical protein Greene101420_635 [Parcubacteria group bacterium Greene1014_20]TSD07164.1 MAG: hypothetical protein Greene07142_333 [Parcubacteria group bacterium Greene0714_2]